MPHANQKARHYSLRQVLNSLRPNVFILNIRGKLLHQRQAMSSEPSALLKSPAAKHTFNYIITLKIVFVQSIVGIKCGSMRLALKKMCPCHNKTNCRGMKGQENSRALLWHRAHCTTYESTDPAPVSSTVVKTFPQSLERRPIHFKSDPAAKLFLHIKACFCSVWELWLICWPSGRRRVITGKDAA